MKKLITGITIPGSVKLIEGQMKYFAGQGYDTALITRQDSRSLAYCEREGCRALNVEIAREISIRQDIKTLRALIRIFRQERPDIVNVGTPKMGLLGMLAARRAGVKNRIYTCRGFRYESERGLKRFILKCTEWATGRAAHKIICISPSVLELGVRDHLFRREKCVVINHGSSNGIDPTRFTRAAVPEADTLRLKQELKLEGKFVYGFLGRVVDRKGIAELFEAFQRIYSKHPDTRLLIVGPWEENQISDLSLKARMEAHEGVVMPGRTDNPALYFTVMDIFVLPAWWEGFGNVVVQAADMGLPVIGSKGTGVCDAVADGYNGINVEPHNPDDLYRVMNLMYNDPDLRHRLAANGPEWGKNFIPERIWQGMEKIYEER